jgi:signal transduction histidine kinase
MDKFEVARLVILGLGWPILILGSIRLALQARRFYDDVGGASFGRLVGVLVAGLLVSMYSLGVTATAFMAIDPAKGVPIVVPVFAGWFMLMTLVALSLGRWTREVAAVNQIQAKLAEAMRVRTDLVNRASHELSTPLTPLLIQVALLKDPQLGPLTQAQTKALQIVERNVARLTSLVREMMDVARLQSGHLQLARDDVDLSEILREAFDSYRPAAREAKLQFEQDIEAGIHVEADPIRVAQIVQNLLSNAIQFTGANGSVRVLARRVADRAEVTVQDTGIGFRQDEAPKLFEPFTQLEPARARKGSVGLGLFVAQTIVEAHGGQIWARSEGPGHGAVFGFSLPLPPTVAPAPASMQNVTRAVGAHLN